MPSSKLEAISKEDCLALLGKATIGRVALSVGAIPEIFPVNFCLIDDAIVFRAARGTRLHKGSRDAVVAFQVDDFDVDARHGWSVLVVGLANEITEPEAVAMARHHLDDGWVVGDEDDILHITPHRVSGRRIAAHS